MAISINVLENGEGIEFIFSDRVIGEDVIALQKPDLTAKGFPPNFRYLLIDYSNVRESYVSAEEVKIIAENDRKLFELLPHLVIAAVVPNEVFRSVSNLWITMVSNEVTEYNTSPIEQMLKRG